MKGYKDNEARRKNRLEHYNSVDTNDKLIINLRDLSHIMRFLYEGKGSQRRVLIILNETGKITQRELTERMGIQPGSASEVIAKLEEAGYVTRTPSETDRRTADIELTQEGKMSAQEATEQRNKRHEEMFSCLSEDEKNSLLLLLEKVNKDWEERYREAEEDRHIPLRSHGSHHHGGHRGGYHEDYHGNYHEGHHGEQHKEHHAGNNHGNHSYEENQTDKGNDKVNL